MAEGKTIVLDELVEPEIMAVRKIVAKARTGIMASGADAQTATRRFTWSMYDAVVHELSEGTRNTPAQLQYLDAYEQALAVFRAAALQLRVELDVLTLEQRLATRQNASAGSNKAQGAASAQDELQEKIADAIAFSNRYALFFAGNVGIALLNSEKPSGVKSHFTFGAAFEASQDRDEHTAALAKQNSNDLVRVIAEKRSQGMQVSDDDLRYTLEGIFASWINQFNWRTFKDVAEPFGADKLKLQYGQFSAEAAAFQRRHTSVIVDERFMAARKADIINSGDYVNAIWDNMIKLLAYDHQRRKNPYDPAFCMFTFGAPGGGKTFIAHALVRELEELCRQHGVPLWAFTHSTTDYASHYQNLTANQLTQLAARVRDFPGPVIMYVADADNIFQSRKDPRLTAEQQQTLAVYFKMFDGQLIPKNGKFMAIMDANYIEGIDDATKSRLFDEILELRRFGRAEDFARLSMMQLTKGMDRGMPISDDDWLAIGNYLLKSPLSNREIGHIINNLRRGFDVPESMVGAPYEEHVAYRNTQMQGITRDMVTARFEDYITNRLAVERASREARLTDDLQRFLGFLDIKGGETLIPPPSTG